MLAGLLDLVAPPRCAACGARGDPPWCARCRDLAAAVRHRGGCPRCAGGCPPGGRRCPLGAVDVAGTLALYAYTGVVARTVVAAKVGGQHAAWRPLGRQLGAVVAAAAPPVDLVVPVGTDPASVRRRGFDHAWRLARPVARALGVPAARLLHTRPRSPDRGRDRPEGDLPTGSVRARPEVAGHHVLLVDDVLTTGATARAAARALGRAGAASVHVAVLARAGR